MSHQVEYQECYRQLAHKSVINAMVISPDGGRLVTGSDDCTVFVWSTQSGSKLCHIKSHSPVISLAWLTNSDAFLLGCKNGVLASVGLSEVRYTETVESTSD
jgi:WD40 repeat protein